MVVARFAGPRERFPEPFAPEKFSLTACSRRQYREIKQFRDQGGTMKTRSTAVRASRLLAALGLAVSMWPQAAAAFHIKGANVTVVSVDSSTRTVTIDAAEFTCTPGGPHTAGNIAWGDGMSTNKVWTATVLGSPTPALNTYKVSGVTHIYPDLTDRTITLTSDCCNSIGFSPDQDTALVQLECSDTPKGGCDASATKAQVQIKNDPDDTKDKLKFKWTNGTVASFDTPGEYYACVYDTGGLKIHGVARGASWSPTGNGFKYNDPAAASGGLKKSILKNGTGTAKINVKGQGTGLDDPNLLPLVPPVFVQLQNSAGNCWEHLFTSPEQSNTGSSYKDKEP